MAVPQKRSFIALMITTFSLLGMVHATPRAHLTFGVDTCPNGSGFEEAQVMTVTCDGANEAQLLAPELKQRIREM